MLLLALQVISVVLLYFHANGGRHAIWTNEEMRAFMMSSGIILPSPARNV
jgi:hypothetical protein